MIKSNQPLGVNTMEITLNLFHLIAGALALFGGTVIAMTIIFGNYILKHLLVPAMKREKWPGTFSGLTINFANKMQNIWDVFFCWLALVVLCLLIPFMKPAEYKVLVSGLIMIMIIGVILTYPRFWQVSLKKLDANKHPGTKTTEEGGQDAGI